MRTPQQPARTGFTMIELIVVVFIIILLMSLVVAGVFKVIGRGTEVQTWNEISQLATGTTTFKQNLGVGYPPSKFFISNTRSDYDPVSPDDGFNQLRADSLQFLNRMFQGKLDWSKVDWTGGQGFAGGRTWTILEGDQCLVFFLGGIQKDGGCRGFSTSNSNPTQDAGDRRGPYYTAFTADRLHHRENSQPGGGAPFLSYKDYWATGGRFNYYAYFSTGAGQNQYNTFGCPPGQMPASGQASPLAYHQITFTYPDGSTDTLSPYVSSWDKTTGIIRYYNGDTFQIISAGADTRFGPGLNTWSPKNAYFGDPALGIPSHSQGNDDQSNFYSPLLGVPGG
jgi:hypothetical protein